MAVVGHSRTNATKKPKRTDLGVDLVRLLSAEGHRIFSIETARKNSKRVALRDPYLRQALYHLRRNGWIIPLRRGLYAISSAAPGVLPTHEFEIAMALVEPAAISHWSAMHHHGLTEQLSRDVFVSTTRTSVPRVRGGKAADSHPGYPVAGTVYRFIQMKPRYFFGAQKVWIGEARINMTDPERTLLDGLAMPKYCGDFAEVLHAFEVRRPQLDLQRIIGYALRLGGAASKRLGWVLERQGIALAELRPLEDLPVTSYNRLDASGPREGPYNARWMIQENLEGRARF